jgi:hypothetical protein
MAHITIEIGNKHVEVILEGLRSFIQDCETVEASETQAMSKKQRRKLKELNKLKDAAFEVIMRLQIELVKQQSKQANKHGKTIDSIVSNSE